MTVDLWEAMRRGDSAAEAIDKYNLNLGYDDKISYKARIFRPDPASFIGRCINIDVS